MPYTKRVTSAVRESTQLFTMENRTVSIEFAEKVEGGFFSSTHILFHIKLGIEEMPVKRRSSDFVWLRATLIKEFPLSYIPPLAFIENKPTDPDYTHWQLRDFELFLREILHNEELRSSEVLVPFLMLPDQPQFSEAKKRLDNELAKQTEFKASVAKKTIEFYPKDCLDFEKIKTKIGHVSGTLTQFDLKISGSLKDFYTQYNETSESTRSFIGQLKDLSRNLHDSLKKTEAIYREMSRVCAMLHQHSVEFNQENSNSENEVFGRIFFSLQNMFLLQGEAQKREASVARDNLQATFTQWERELYSLEDVYRSLTT